AAMLAPSQEWNDGPTNKIREVQTRPPSLALKYPIRWFDRLAEIPFLAQSLQMMTVVIQHQLQDRQDRHGILARFCFGHSLPREPHGTLYAQAFPVIVLPLQTTQLCQP